jgi:PAS domain S-box-containing protein
MSDQAKQPDLRALVQTMERRIEELERELSAKGEFEERLQDSEERFRQVTNTIDEVFWMTDPRKDRMLFISQAYERIWGRTCKSIIEQPLSFVESIYPDDREAVMAAFPKQKEGTYDIEYRIVRQDGGIRWIRDKAFPVRDASGEIYRVVGVAQDITEN